MSRLGRSGGSGIIFESLNASRGKGENTSLSFRHRGKVTFCYFLFESAAGPTLALSLSTTPDFVHFRSILSTFTSHSIAMAPKPASTAGKAPTSGKARECLTVLQGHAGRLL